MTWRGLGHGEVLDAVPRVPPRVLGQRAGVGVEGHVDGPVADRVGGDLPAGAVRGDDRGLQVRGVGLQVAAPGARVGVPVGPRVGVMDGGGAADQGTVGEDLHGADPEPLVAEPGPDTQVQAQVQAVVGVRAQGVQHLGGHHQLDPDAQPALIPDGLVGGQLDRAVADPAAADARLGAAGDALDRYTSAARAMASASSASGYG